MTAENPRRHTMIAWVEDKPGVLNRISGLFGRRKFQFHNIDILHTLIKTQNPTL